MSERILRWIDESDQRTAVACALKGGRKMLRLTGPELHHTKDEIPVPKKIVIHEAGFYGSDWPDVFRQAEAAIERRSEP